MQACSMCGRQMEEPDDYIIGVKPICAECSQKIKDIVESRDPQILREAFNYIYTCQKRDLDPAVSHALKQYLENNRSAFEDLEETAGDAPAQTDRLADFFKETAEEEQTSGNIPAISVLLGILAAIVWIGGLALAIDISQDTRGSAAFFVIIFVALVLGGLLMATSSIVMYLARISASTDVIRRRMRK